MALASRSAGAAPLWQVHSTLARSAANGPGLRFVVWSQGCSLACAGCFNPETQEPHAASARRVKTWSTRWPAPTALKG
ncbi:4Fe-4S cluster-binding domain-containing protein [Streptomyces sannanensis]|uniref:4Fe-4S cluster-binding domain-containing protein n=1 Tax=Streptomyces sannanensis TaxID=285536 RepID=UPI003CD084F3